MLFCDKSPQKKTRQLKSLCLAVNSVLTINAIFTVNAILMLTSVSHLAHADDEPVAQLDTITIYAKKDTVNPLGEGQKVSDVVVDGEAFSSRSATLGDALAKEVGVHSSQFGGGASNPIIRGQEGVRLKILQNGLGVVDMSQISPDHASATDTLLAERVELMRGASTLMHDSHSTAGVVNVIDGRIPKQMPATTAEFGKSLPSVMTPISYEGDFGWRYNSNNHEKIMTASVTTGIGEHLALRVEGLKRDADDYHVPEINLGKSIDYVPDTYNESQVTTVGLSYIDDFGYLGASVSKREDSYGLPGHNHKFDSCLGHINDLQQSSLIPRRYLTPYPHLMDDTDVINYPHFHCGSDHANDPSHSHDHPYGHEHDHTHKGPWVELDSERIDLRAEFNQPLPYLDKLKLSYANSKYYHDERDPGKSIDNQGNTVYNPEFDGVPVNFFRNEGDNAKLEIYHQPIKGFKGVVGVQYSDHQSSAHIPREREIGARYPLIPSKNRQISLFGMEQYRVNDDLLLEVGGRIEKQKISIDYDEQVLDRYMNPHKYCTPILGLKCPSSSPTQQPDLSPYQETAHSFAGTALWDVNVFDNVDNQLTFTYSHNERLPTPFELYYHGKHLATNSFEYGNKDLEKESSDNFEIGFSGDHDKYSYGISTYYNQFDNYIYNQTLYREGNLFLRRNTQSKADFYGIEGSLTYYPNDDHQLTVFGDYLRGKLHDLPDVRKKYDTGKTNVYGDPITDVKMMPQADRNAPRVPPARLGMRWKGQITDSIEGNAELQHVFTQSDVSTLESETKGHNLLNLGIGYRNQLDNKLGSYEYHLFLNANNLLDEKVYNHSSFLPYVPQMGRNFMMGVNVSF